MIDPFKVWYDQLAALAKAEDLPWLISNDPEDHREAYDAGYTPAEELDDQKCDASR